MNRKLAVGTMQLIAAMFGSAILASSPLQSIGIFLCIWAVMPVIR